MLRLLLLAALCIALASAHGAADPCPPDVQTCLDAGSNCEDLNAGADFFCAPGSVNSNGFIAGCICQPLPTIGQACNNATCVDAKYEPTCHDDGFCRWVGIFGPGESCVSGDPNYVNGGCLSDSVCQSGKCSGAQTLAASGAACATSADCQHGLACVFSDQGVKQCARPWSAPAGAACDSSEQCEAGLFCNTDGGANRCEVLTAIDLVCTGNAFGCPGLTYPEPPLYCECPHNAGSNPANYTNTGVGLCRPSLSWVPNSDARDAWSALSKCLSKNGCARGTAFGPGSCADTHCAPQVAALHLFTGRLGKRTCAELAQLPFVIGGESAGAALAASALLCALLALALAL